MMEALTTKVEALETERLRGRPVCEADFDLLHGLHRDPRVMATLGGLRDEARTRQLLDMFMAHWGAMGFGIWMLFDRESGAFIGRAGLRCIEILGQAKVEVLYALLPDFWGRGLATEAAQASVEVGFREVGLPELVACTLKNNKASRRVMEKAGFRYDRKFVSNALPHVLYRQRARTKV